MIAGNDPETGLPLINFLQFFGSGMSTPISIIVQKRMGFAARFGTDQYRYLPPFLHLKEFPASGIGRNDVNGKAEYLSFSYLIDNRLGPAGSRSHFS